VSEERGGDFTTTPIGWINKKQDKNNKPFLTLKCSSNASGIVLREGMTFIAFPRYDRDPPYFMWLIDNDALAEARIDGDYSAGSVPQRKPKDEVDMGEDLDLGF
jgi:hypothetical protein